MVAIFVILTIVAFIVADSIVQWSQAKSEQRHGDTVTGRRRESRRVADLIPAFAFEGISVPQGIFVDAGHTWVGLKASGRTHIGMDQFAQNVIGRIDEVELPEVGREVRRGEKLFAVRQGDRKADFVAPMDGVVSSVNEELGRHPEAIKADPYQQGWICALKPKNLAKNLKQLSIAEEAAAWLDKEVQRFQEFFALRPIQSMALGYVLQDGGRLTGGVLELLDDETWHLFTSEFLQRKVATNQ
ncbi:MAG: hypothetical protein HY314_08390 [Acidobacteria bacterium]|nr:hypothetical protein [Acidobacteriota bacterium]